MPFERYEHLRRPAPPSRAATFTLQPSKRATLSELAVQDLARPLAVDTPEAVQLYFDRDRQIMGLRAVARGTPHAYTLSKQKNGSTMVFTARTFFDHYGIDPGNVSRRFPTFMEGDLLCIDLNGESEIVTGPRTLQRAKRAAEMDNDSSDTGAAPRLSRAVAG